MAPARASGFSLTGDDVPFVVGMAARGDRNHDIAAWFGVNQGRIKEAKDGKFGPPVAAPAHKLPPSGPPGVKGRRVRAAAQTALELLEGTEDGRVGRAIKLLRDAIARYDTNEA